MGTDCQNVDFGSCGGACCKLDFILPHSAQAVVTALNKSLGDGGADHMYTLQTLAEGPLGFAQVDKDGEKFIGQVVHKTAGGFNDTLNFRIEQAGANHSKVRAFSVSQIGGVGMDNGQNFKNIMLAMKTACNVTDLKFMPVDGSCPQPVDKNIVQFIRSEQNLSILVSTVVAAELADTLISPGPYTLFAPTNDAFKALPEGLFDDLMKPANKAKLVNILKYHILQGKMLAADFMWSKTVTTMQGQPLFVQMWNKEFHVGASAASKDLKNVTSKDNLASNGAVHVIDGVLLPPGTVSV